MANGLSGDGCGVLEKVQTGQEHGPKWSVVNVRTDMARNSEHCSLPSNHWQYANNPSNLYCPIMEYSSEHMISTVGKSSQISPPPKAILAFFNHPQNKIFKQKRKRLNDKKEHSDSKIQ